MAIVIFRVGLFNFSVFYIRVFRLYTVTTVLPITDVDAVDAAQGLVIGSESARH